jgi:hypothetical protein
LQTADARRCNLSMARCNDSSVTATSQPNLIPFVVVLWVMLIDTRLISVVNYKQQAPALPNRASEYSNIN